MKKVLYFGMSSNLGGIESFIINFWRSFDHRNLQVDFVKFEEEICFEDELLKGGSQVYRLPPRRKNPKQFLMELYKFFKNHLEYQVIHVHLNTSSFIEPALIAKLFKRKVIVHSHSEWKGKRLIPKLLHQINRPILNKIADVKLACSDEAGRWMFGQSDFFVVKNAIDASSYTYDTVTRKRLRKQFGLEGKFVVGNIGRLVYEKNHDFLIEVFVELRNQCDNAVLLIIGDGVLRAQLEDKILELGLSQNVMLMGVRTDVAALLQMMDVFIFPSRFEGLGIAAIEAQAAGLPCIVADTIPQEAFVTNLVETVTLSSDRKKWVEAILKFSQGYSRIDTYKEIREAGYDISQEASKLVDLYT